MRWGGKKEEGREWKCKVVEVEIEERGKERRAVKYWGIKCKKEDGRDDTL